MISFAIASLSNTMPSVSCSLDVNNNQDSSLARNCHGAPSAGVTSKVEASDDEFVFPHSVCVASRYFLIQTNFPPFKDRDATQPRGVISK